MRCEAITVAGTRCKRSGPGVGWIRHEGREVQACAEHYIRSKARLPVSFMDPHLAVVQRDKP